MNALSLSNLFFFYTWTGRDGTITGPDGFQTFANALRAGGGGGGGGGGMRAEQYTLPSVTLSARATMRGLLHRTRHP